MTHRDCPPVLFIIFNRPDLTRRVFERIRRAQPKQLFVAADSPRSDVSTDVELCAKARQVIDLVDWDCEVRTLFQESNLGCGLGPMTAINWFFENVEQGIILEDDCLPSDCFFSFCEQMLTFYQNDTRIVSISGTNILTEWSGSKYAYIFSYYGGNWGWATWRRAWSKNDHNMKLWHQDENRKYIEYVLSDRAQAEGVGNYWFDFVAGRESDIWDIQWLFSRLINSGLSIVPVKNLISNIGFGPGATHTRSATDFSNLPQFEIEMPVAVNPVIVVDRDFDRENAKRYGFTGLRRFIKPFISRITALIKKHGNR